MAEWLLPLDLPTPSPSMQLEREVGIGRVGTPLKVELRLKNATFSEEEIRMRILQEGDWDALDALAVLGRNSC